MECGAIAPLWIECVALSNLPTTLGRHKIQSGDVASLVAALHIGYDGAWPLTKKWLKFTVKLYRPRMCVSSSDIQSFEVIIPIGCGRNHGTKKVSDE